MAAKMKLGLTILGTLLLLLIMVKGSEALGAGSVLSNEVQDKPGKFIMLVLDRISLADFDNPGLPNLRYLAQHGAVGLMNTNAAGPRLPDSTYATIGAGARIASAPFGGEGYNPDELINEERAGDIYYRRMGIKPGPNQVVHLQVPRLTALNLEQKYPCLPGALGMALHQAGLKTGVLGNSDTGQPYRGRQAVTIAMDEKGIVDWGNVSHTLLKPDSSAIWGFSTDYSALWQQYLLGRDLVDMLVVEIGDTSRVDEGTDIASLQVQGQQRQLALREADKFLGRVLGTLNREKDILALVTPTPGDVKIREKLLLTPVVLMGKDVQPGLLTTSTTKRPGLLTNIDLAPTVLEHFGVSRPTQMLGQPGYGVSEAKPLVYLRSLEEQANYTYLARPTLVKGYVFLQMVGVVLALCTVFLGKPGPEVMKKNLLALMAIPLSLLLQPLIPVQNLLYATGICLLITALTVYLALLAGGNRELDAFIFICLLTVGVILGDALAGSPLIKQSSLGYDPMVGARFYGIGNEYMGVLLGALIIGTAALMQRLPKWRKVLLLAIGVTYFAATYILAAPNLGTNVGGTIAAVAGLGFTYTWLTGRYPSWRTGVGLVLGTLLVGMAFIGYDMFRPAESQTHMGRVAHLILQNGYSEVFNVILRKLAVNIKLIVNITIWARVLLVSIVALGILFYRPVGVMEILREKYHYMYIGFVGVVIGSIVALAFNDSGIVAAATMIIYCSAPLIYLVIQEVTQSPENP
ncbi:MAG TPA: hypothetical protein VHS59_05830 [Bacillota bacterium]|nr:hypothetical protein [Bacillota bacterium]